MNALLVRSFTATVRVASVHLKVSFSDLVFLSQTHFLLYGLTGLQRGCGGLLRVHVDCEFENATNALTAIAP